MRLGNAACGLVNVRKFLSIKENKPGAVPKWSGAKKLHLWSTSVAFPFCRTVRNGLLPAAAVISQTEVSLPKPYIEAASESLPLGHKITSCGKCGCQCGRVYPFVDWPLPRL